jgi:hypothetical protein
MNELEASLSPTSLPCNSETDQADVQYAWLQLTVTNVSGAPIDVSAIELLIEFVVDPAGTTGGTPAALILAGYAASVDAAPAPGTNWSLPRSQSAPCAFNAIPGANTMEADEEAIFLFTDIAVDQAQGTSNVTVTVIPQIPGGLTVANTPPVTKTAPVLAVMSFTAVPQLLIPPANTTTLGWTTIGAGDCQLGWHPSSANVYDNGGPLTTNPSPVPLQAAGTPDSPYLTAELFDDTQFTLSATGAVTLAPQCVVRVDQATFSAVDAATQSIPVYTVSPWEIFALKWTCLPNAGATINVDDPAAVYNIITPGGQIITPGETPLDASGYAFAIITSGVNFTLSMSPECRPIPPVPVGVHEVQFSGFTGIAKVVNAAIGLQTANLTWTAANVVSFTLAAIDLDTNQAVPIANPDYNAASASVDLPLLTFPFGSWQLPTPVTFTLTAEGYTAPGQQAPDPITITVDPIEVSLSSFTASTYYPARGQSVWLYWSAVAATGFKLADQIFLGDVAAWQTPKLYSTTTFEIIAYGYFSPSATTLPTMSLTITVPPPKAKPEGKEGIAHKENLPEVPPVPAGAPEPDLPSGSQQAFISPAERPPVDANPPDADPDSPSGPQG